MNESEFDDFARPYKCAEITTVYLKSVKNQHEFVHVYSVVELVPETQKFSEELPRTNSDIYFTKKHKVVIQRKNCDIKTAKRYFYSEHEIILPHYGRNVRIGELTMEPAHGYAVLSPSGWHEHSVENILPKRKMGFRIVLRLDTGKDLKKYVESIYPNSKEYLVKLSKLIDSKLKIKFSEYGEYLGGMLLAAQNPLIFYISRFDAGTSLCWHLLLMPRKNQSVRGIKLLLLKNSKMGIVYSKPIIVDSPVVKVDLPCDMWNVRIMMWDSDDNLLEDSNLHYFGHEKDSESKALINEHETRRSLEHLEKTREFVYFKHGEREKATKAIIDVLNGAHKSLIICDPYLRDDVFMLCEQMDKINNRKLTLALFTSQRVFHKGGEYDVEFLKKFQESINNYKNKLFHNEIICYVLCGKEHDNGLLHDRFIVRDDNKVWSLGSSINSFGKSDTMLISLPKDSVGSILKRIEEWKNNSSDAVEFSKFARGIVNGS